MEKTELKTKELPPEALCRVCNPATFSFQSTAELPYVLGIIGQDRAVKAIHFGLDIQSPGFNTFVMGPTGTGRRSILYRIVSEQAGRAKTPDDWVYVNHFTDPGAPRAICLPPGQGGAVPYRHGAFQQRVDGSSVAGF